MSKSDIFTIILLKHYEYLAKKATSRKLILYNFTSCLKNSFKASFQLGITNPVAFAFAKLIVELRGRFLSRELT